MSKKDIKTHTGKRKKKRRWKWIPAALGLLVAAGVLLAAALFLQSIRKGTDEKQWFSEKPAGNEQAGTEGQNSTVTADGADLILLIDETDFITGSESRAAVTVLYTDKIKDNITVTDENGQAFCEIENNGSGHGEAVITVPTAKDGCIRYQAVSDSHASNQITCYIHPEITSEMVRTLAEVSDDLGVFVTGQNFEDPLSNEALQKVKAYLLSDDRVADAWENEGAVLYATTDSLMGSYGLGASDEMSFGGKVPDSEKMSSGNGFTDLDEMKTGSGFSDPYETYRSYTEGEDVSGWTVKSTKTLTNKKFLHLSPLPEDRLVGVTKESYVSKECDLADAVHGDFSYAERENAWELFETGAFTDAGFLTLVSHGKRLERRGGSYMFCFAMGEMDSEEFQDVFDGKRLNAGKLWGAYDLDGEYIHSRESYRLLYDYDITEPESPRILFATTNYIESVLKDRVFDNTVIFFCVCHSAVDEKLISLLLDHGAGAFVGSVPTLDAPVAYSVFCGFADVFGNGGTIGGVAEKVRSGAYDNEELAWYNETFAENVSRSDMETWQAESKIVYRVRDSAKRTMCGSGKLSGSVIDSDGVPVAGADITVHHWLDHACETVSVTKTDREGRFEVSETDWGIYGITAEKAYGKAKIRCKTYGVLEISADKDTAEPIVLQCDLPVVFSSCMGEYKGTLYKIRDAVDTDGIRIETLPVGSPDPDMYICGFAFYDSQIFYCCKEAGTSDYRSALYVCDSDGSHNRKLKEGCTEFYITGGELHCWSSEYYDVAEKCWKTADWEEEYMWGEPQFFTMDACYMFWQGDGVYRQNYEMKENGDIAFEANRCVLDCTAVEMGYGPRLVFATDRYLFLDYTRQNMSYFGCYDMETGTLHILDKHQEAGSGYYFNW